MPVTLYPSDTAGQRLQQQTSNLVPEIYKGPSCREWDDFG